jgi:hypothetical protein
MFLRESIAANSPGGKFLFRLGQNRSGYSATNVNVKLPQAHSSNVELDAEQNGNAVTVTFLVHGPSATFGSMMPQLDKMKLGAIAGAATGSALGSNAAGIDGFWGGGLLGGAVGFVLGDALPDPTFSLKFDAAVSMRFADPNQDFGNSDTFTNRFSATIGAENNQLSPTNVTAVLMPLLNLKVSATDGNSMDKATGNNLESLSLLDALIAGNLTAAANDGATKVEVKIVQDPNFPNETVLEYVAEGLVPVVNRMSLTAQSDGTYGLTVSGEAGAAGNDITLGTDAAGGVQVVRNGQVTNYDPTVLGISSVEIDPGAGVNTVTIDSTLASLPVTVNATSTDAINVLGAGGPVNIVGNGNTDVRLGDNGSLFASGSLQNILGRVSVSSTGGIVNLDVNASGDQAGQTGATLGPAVFGVLPIPGYQELLGLGPTGIDYSADNVRPTIELPAGETLDVYSTGTVDTGIWTQSGDTVNLHGTRGSATILGAGGNVTLGDNGSLSNLWGPVYDLQRTGGTLTIDDSGDSTSPTATLGLSTTTVGGFFTMPVAQLSVQPTDPNARWQDVNYGNEVSPIIDLGSGTLTVNGTGTQVTTINASGANVNLFGTNSGVLVHATGGSTVLVGGFGSLQGITSWVAMNSADRTANLIVDDSNDTTAHASAALSQAMLFGAFGIPGWEDLSGLAPDDIFYQGDQVTPTLDLGANTNLAVNATGSAATAINSFANTADTITVGGTADSLDGLAGTITVNGNGADSLIVNDQQGQGITLPAGETLTSQSLSYGISGQQITRQAGGAYSSSLPYDFGPGFGFWLTQFTIAYAGVGNVAVTGSNVGATYTVSGTAAPTTVSGGSGNDTFRMTAPSSAFDALNLDGQGGVNTLDYSGYQGDVMVDLPLGTATGVSGSIANMQNVTGGQGNSILVGNGGNVLTGGTGRNLLIAGPTASTLVGNSGEDVLVGGTTDFDTNAPALIALMTEWSRPDLPYASRVQNLLTGGGLNGTTLLDASTFHSNGGGNTLTGGTGLDLFCGLLPGDSGTADTTDWNAAQGEVLIDPNGVHAQVGIDATHLSSTWVVLDNQWLSTSAPLSLALQPGTHTLATPGGGSVTFQVGLSGVISYDQQLGSTGIFSGQGTNQLIVNGAPVAVDATALTNPSVWVDSYTVETTAAPFTLHLLPGTHRLDGAGGGWVTFTVAADGSVSIDPQLANAGILNVRGANQLTVSGATVNVNAQALTNLSVWVDSYTVETTAAPFTVHLLPGTHRLDSAGGGGVTFTVNNDGSVSIDPQLANAGILSVQGINQLTVSGATVNVNAQALTNLSVWVDSYTVETTAAPFTLHLLPGTHRLDGAGGSVTFTVNPDGSISFPASEDSLLSLQGNATLIVKALS